MEKRIQQEITIPEHLQGERLDSSLATLLPDYSRSNFKNWITKGDILLNHKTCQPKTKVTSNDLISLNIQPESQIPWQGQAIALDIIHEDESLIIINKPANLVVHPAAGNPDGTLVNALLHHCPELTNLPRAGIVHRLDKDTTGLLVVAKTLKAHHHLVKALQARTVKRVYQAIVYGIFTGGGTINAPIARHPRNRIKMAVVREGKPATTHYTIAERFRDFTHIEVKLETGRTHQIRVHFAHLHHPLLGDPLYARLRFPKAASEAVKQLMQQCYRQMLHASELSFIHPNHQEVVQFTAPLPEDMKNILASLRHENPAT